MLGGIGFSVPELPVLPGLAVLWKLFGASESRIRETKWYLVRFILRKLTVTYINYRPSAMGWGREGGLNGFALNKMSPLVYHLPLSSTQLETQKADKKLKRKLADRGLRLKRLVLGSQNLIWYVSREINILFLVKKWTFSYI